MKRRLKPKYRKKESTSTPPKQLTMEKIRKITKIVKPKKSKPVGRWCQYYSGRLPYPIECSNNKSMPVSTLFTEGKPKIIRNFPACVYCERSPSFHSWKRGDWDKIIQAIENGEDLQNMPAPGKEE